MDKENRIQQIEQKIVRIKEELVPVARSVMGCAHWRKRLES